MRRHSLRASSVRRVGACASAGIALRAIPFDVPLAEAAATAYCRSCESTRGTALQQSLRPRRPPRPGEQNSHEACAGTLSSASSHVSRRTAREIDSRCGEYGRAWLRRLQERYTRTHCRHGPGVRVLALAGPSATGCRGRSLQGRIHGVPASAKTRTPGPCPQLAIRVRRP